MLENTQVSPGEWVCITGANGFIGSHLAEELLKHGFGVVATVRNPDDPLKTDHLLAIAERHQASDRLRIARGDLMEAGSFDDAFERCAAICHTAAAVQFTADDPQRDIVDPSVQGTLNVLRSAVATPKVRRIVHTSSMAAVYRTDEKARPPFDESDWNDSATLDVDPYALAKVTAERAAVDFMANLETENAPRLVHINPGMVWGPPMTKAHSKASPILLRNIMRAKPNGVAKLMLSPVDVREVVQAHRLALTHAEPPARCIIAAENLWMPEIARQLQALYPSIKMGTRQLPKAAILIAAMLSKKLHRKQLQTLVGRPLQLDNSLSKSAYHIEYRLLEDTLRDTADALIEHGWV